MSILIIAAMVIVVVSVVRFVTKHMVGAVEHHFGDVTLEENRRARNIAALEHNLSIAGHEDECRTCQIDKFHAANVLYSMTNHARWSKEAIEESGYEPIEVTTFGDRERRYVNGHRLTGTGFPSNPANGGQVGQYRWFDQNGTWVVVE